MPSLEDCKKTMQSNLPKAHRKAIEMLSYTIEFFSSVFDVVSSGPSIDDITRRLGEGRTRFLAIYWSIYVDPKVRKSKNMEPRPSWLHLCLEILHPLKRILSVYRETKAGLERGDFSYECEYKGDFLYELKCGSKGDKADAYVHTVVGKPFGDIHLCVDEIPDVNDIADIAEIIIHEASHKFAGTDDDSKVPWENAYVVASGMPAHLQ